VRAPDTQAAAAARAYLPAALHRCNPGARPNGSQAGGRTAVFESPPFRIHWGKPSQPGGAPKSAPHLMRLLRRLLSRLAPLGIRNSEVANALGRSHPPGAAPAPLTRSPLGGRIDHSGAPVGALDAG